jgi:hypothetical protein
MPLVGFLGPEVLQALKSDGGWSPSERIAGEEGRGELITLCSEGKWIGWVPNLLTISQEDFAKLS